MCLLLVVRIALLRNPYAVTVDVGSLQGLRYGTYVGFLPWLLNYWSNNYAASIEFGPIRFFACKPYFFLSHGDFVMHEYSWCFTHFRGSHRSQEWKKK